MSSEAQSPKPWSTDPESDGKEDGQTSAENVQKPWTTDTWDDDWGNFDAVLKKPRPQRNEIASSPEDFAQQREAFVQAQTAHWESRIDKAVKDFYNDFALKIETYSPERKRRAAQLLAQFEFGVHIMHQRYHKQTADDSEDIQFLTDTVSLPQGTLYPDVFSYHHTPRSMWGSNIYVQLQWVLGISEDPQKWYDEYKTSGGQLGPINFDKIDDLFLFGGFEEAAHKLYLTHEVEWDYSANPKPVSGEFYYAHDLEFQTLKTMYFFAKKFVPETAEALKEQMLKMIEHRKK